MLSVKNYFQNLNLFKLLDNCVDEDKEHEHRSNIITTRVYLTVLPVAVLIISFGFWSYPQTIIITVESPTINEFKALPSDAHCPCSHMSIPYGEFTSIESMFHQVCSSEFVTDRWFKALFFGSNSTYFDITDFRVYGSAQFQALGSFCRLAKAAAIQSISLFYMTPFISSQMQTETVFQLQAEASIAQFQRTAPEQFMKQLELVRKMIMANGLISGLQTNAILVYPNSMIDKSYIVMWITSYSFDDECICIINFDCIKSAQILNSFREPIQLDNSSKKEVLMDIPGLIISCLPANSMFLSTLECMYNQTCLDELLSYFSTTENFTAMKTLEKSRFKYNSTVQTMFNDLMVEEWFVNISFDKYYTLCAPTLCTYSKLTPPAVLFVLATAVRSFGGLTVAFNLIIPIIIRFLRRPRKVEKTPLSIRIRHIKLKMKQTLIELNIFKRQDSNEHQVRYQRIGTRLYIIILTISLVIFTFYSLLIKEMHRKTILNPSESEYERLEHIYPDSLSCPCKSIYMNYSTFIKIEPHFHQVCSSDLVSKEWIIYNSGSGPNTLYRFNEYRGLVTNYFLLLAMFCQETRKTIDDALGVFLQTQFVSGQVISRQLFESEANLSIHNWRLNTIERFLRTIQLIQAFNSGNQFYSSLAGIFRHINRDFGEIILRTDQYADNCSCTFSSSCRSLVGIYNQSDYSEETIPLVSIPNIFIGCFPIDGLFQSTLECFYNQSCMIEIDQYMHSSLGKSFNFSSLDSNRNRPNEIIESIIQRLMVDSWTSTISFTSYYHRCAPQLCTFESFGRSHIFSVVTAVIGIFGGLSLGWKLLILTILRFLEKMINNFSRVALKRIAKNLFTCGTQQQIINRLHFILLVITLGIIYTFSSSSLQPKTIQVIKPSFSIYQNLEKRSLKSLQCFCSNVSIEYRSFFSITPRVHPICSSEFVSNQWIEYLYGNGDFVQRFPPTNFRLSASSQFQLLISLCQLSQAVMNDSILQLMTSDLINTQLLSSSLLEKRLQTVINEFQFNTPKSFLSTMNAIREIIGVNMIMSTLSTDWKIIPDAQMHPDWMIHTEPVIYEECNCGLSWKCTQPSERMMTGCYPIEALLQTTLQCFYDQQCIDVNGTFSQLNISTLEKSRFNVNTTIESMLHYLMVEEYSTQISYERYYNQCAPSLCSYTHVGHRSTIDIITSLIGLYGGLSIITQFLASILTKLWLYRKHRIHPQITEENT